MIASETLHKKQSIFISSRRLWLENIQQQPAIRTIYAHGAMHYIYPLTDTNEIKWQLQTTLFF